MTTIDWVSNILFEIQHQQQTYHMTKLPDDLMVRQLLTMLDIPYQIIPKEFGGYVRIINEIKGIEHLDKLVSFLENILHDCSIQTT